MKVWLANTVNLAFSSHISRIGTQKLIKSHSLSHRTTWSNRILTRWFVTYFLCRGNDTISLLQARFCETDFWMWMSSVVTTCRNHQVKTALFHFFSYFLLYGKVFFFILLYGFLKRITSFSYFFSEFPQVLLNLQVLLLNGFGSSLKFSKYFIKIL